MKFDPSIVDEKINGAKAFEGEIDHPATFCARPQDPSDEDFCASRISLDRGLKFRKPDSGYATSRCILPLPAHW